MIRRRLAASVPLAVLVAILAHGLRFGTEHVPGTAHASALLGTLGAALGLAGLAIFTLAALRSSYQHRAADTGLRALAPAVGIGGLATYGLIEIGEGHAPFAGGLHVVAAVALATVVVWVAACLAVRALSACGRGFALFAAARRTGPAHPVCAARRPRATRPYRLACASTRVRAPPLLAAAL